MENYVSENITKTNQINTITENIIIEEVKPKKRIFIYIEKKSKMEDSFISSNSRALRLYTLSGYLCIYYSFCPIKQGLLINILDKNTINISNSTKNKLLQNYIFTLSKEVDQLNYSIKPYTEVILLLIKGFQYDWLIK